MSELIDPRANSGNSSNNSNRVVKRTHVNDLEVKLSSLTESLKTAINYDAAVKKIAFELSKEIDTLEAIQKESTELSKKAVISSKRGKLLTDLHKLLDTEHQKESNNTKAQEIAARIIILAKQAMITSGVSQDMIESTVQILIMNLTPEFEGNKS